MKKQTMFNTVFVCVSILTLVLSACGGLAATPHPAAVTVVAYSPTREVVAKEADGPAQPDFFVAPAPGETGLQTGGEVPPNDQAYDAMFFKNYGVNPFIDTEDDHFSTFAMDVDTASYAVMRRYVNDGNLPPAEAIRVEEFINYFNYDYPAPESGTSAPDAFAIHLEGAPSPFGGEKYYLLRVGLQGRRIPTDQRKDAVLTFVIDVSGSMSREDRLGLVKQALALLVEELRPTDQVGIVVYGSRGRVVLEPTPASNASQIMAAINSLQPEGSTNAEEGLRLAYQMASRAFRSDAINRVILCSDGVANVGKTGPDSILKEIKKHADGDITLSTVGFGMGNFNDILMEQLADDGNGNYAYVDTLDEAHRIFVENLTGMLQVIAKDAKVQVDFNPELVSRYRLIGYENRDVADEDFRNDTVDAGEVGSGHNVTALYEIKFKEDLTGLGDLSGLKALTVFVRYQDPETSQVHEINQGLVLSQFASAFETTSPRFQLAASVAEYAEILRESYWAKDSSLENVQGLAQRVKEAMPGDADVAEFAQLVGRAAQIAAR
ncbi:MAG: VWA domain-containing protein [Thermoflexales bacterium]|nr:VWA domain-containing protein [Thermoflexales bacterium]